MQEKSNTEKRYIADSKDVTVEDWNDPMADKYGLKATTRFGHLEKQRGAKITNIKTASTPYSIDCPVRVIRS